MKTIFMLNYIALNLNGFSRLILIFKFLWNWCSDNVLKVSKLNYFICKYDIELYKMQKTAWLWFFEYRDMPVNTLWGRGQPPLTRWWICKIGKMGFKFSGANPINPLIFLIFGLKEAQLFKHSSPLKSALLLSI